MKNIFFVLACFFYVSPAYSQGYSGLIARWSFNGNANDVSGNGLNGIVHGATLTAGYSGLPNTAYQFNGTSDYINVPYNSLMNSKIHSICALVKPLGFNSATCQGNYILCRGLEARSSFYGLEYFDNAYDNNCSVYSPFNEVFSGFTGAPITSDPGSAWYYTPTIVPNTWYCVVLTYNGDSTLTYVNGTLQSTFHHTCTYVNSTDSLTIGKSEFGTTYPYWTDAVIDEIRLYNRVLSATEARMFCDTVEGSYPSHACNTISLPDSIHICSDSSAMISATVSGTDPILNISWVPATGLSNPNILNPTLVTPVTPGWYYLTVNSLNPTNLVVNGDFSAGNTGFTSSYSYVSGPSSLLPPGVYAISTNPHNEHPGGASFHDHTTGSGNMMAVNGASTPIDVWCETFPVTPNTDYNLSAWFADWSGDTAVGLPLIQYKVNGSLVGTGPFTFVPTPGRWTQFQITWNSGINTIANFCINDQQTAFTGNDFAIDDISVNQLCTAIDSVYIDASATGNIGNKHDTSVCPLTGSVTLSAPAGYSSYLWNTGASTSSIVISAGGFYWLSAVSGCGLLKDTFNVTFVSPDTTYGHKDTSSCASTGGIHLNAPAGYTSYLWSTGASTPGIIVSSGGNYGITATKGCTVLIDTIHLIYKPLPTVTLRSDTSICSGDEIILGSPEPPGVTYSWNTGSTDSSIYAAKRGLYKLTVVSNGCAAADSVFISEMTKPASIHVGGDTVLCQGDLLILNSNVTTTKWSNGLQGQTISVTEAGMYWATVSNICGSVSDTVKIDYDLCDIWFPSAFTPNGDGKNDIIRVVGNLKHYTDFSLSIFNRWGQRVFYTQDIYAGWNGIFNGNQQDMGTYFYMIFYSLHGGKHMMKGDFQLIR